MLPALLGVAALVAIAVVAFVLLSGRDAPPSGATSPTPIPTQEPGPTPTPDDAMLGERFTALFIGTDANEQREAEGAAVLADALMVISVSPDQSEVVMISMPRDLFDVPLGDGSTYAAKINALYSERGIDVTVAAMEATYGIDIPYHAVMDMDDFTALVDAVDGVTVNPPEPLVDPIVDLDLPAGEQEIDATTALAYVRTRIDMDYGRMGRQQEVLEQIALKALDVEGDIDFGALAEGFESLETNVPLDKISTLLELARRAQEAEVTNFLLQPPQFITFEGDRGDGRGYILEANFEAIRERVAELIPADD